MRRLLALALMLSLVAGGCARFRAHKEVSPSLGYLGIYTQEGRVLSRGSLVNGLDAIGVADDEMYYYAGFRWGASTVQGLAALAALGSLFIEVNPDWRNKYPSEQRALWIGALVGLIVGEVIDTVALGFLNAAVEKHNAVVRQQSSITSPADEEVAPGQARRSADDDVEISE